MSGTEKTDSFKSLSTEREKRDFLRNLWLDLVSLRSIILSVLCFIISLNFLHCDMTCCIVYFFVTIAWTFASIPLHALGLMTPIALDLLQVVPSVTASKGMFLENSLGILSASIYYFPWKIGTLTEKLVLRFLITFPLLPHNQLFFLIILSALLSAVCPSYIVLFSILPFLESLLEIIAVADRRPYLGSSSKDQSERYRQFDKAFKLALAYSSCIGSTPSLLNSTSGIIVDRVLIRSDNMQLKTWYAVTITITIINLFILWIAILVVFLGVKFTKLCLVSNYQATKNFFYKKAEGERSTLYKDYIKQLGDMKKGYGDFSLSDVLMMCIMLLVFVLAITRKPFFFRGWSDTVLIVVFGLSKEDDGEVIYFSLIVCLASVILFLFPNKQMAYRGESVIVSNVVPGFDTSLPISKWVYVCKYIPWTSILCVGASCCLFYGYIASKIYQKISIGFAFFCGLESYERTKIFLYLIAVFLNIFNFNFVVSYMMVPIAIHVARYQKTNVSKCLLYALLGSRQSFITPFSCRSNVIIFSVTNISREDMLKAGIPLTILCSISTLICLDFFSGEFDNNFDPSVLRYELFNLIG